MARSELYHFNIKKKEFILKKHLVIESEERKKLVFFFILYSFAIISGVLLRLREDDVHTEMNNIQNEKMFTHNTQNSIK